MRFVLPRFYDRDDDYPQSPLGRAARDTELRIKIKVCQEHVPLAIVTYLWEGHCSWGTVIDLCGLLALQLWKDEQDNCTAQMTGCLSPLSNGTDPE